MCVDVEDMIKELKALIEIPSIVGEEGELAKYLAEVLKNYGFTPELHRVEGDRYNVICRVRGDRPGRTLLLNGHLDTVPVASGWRTNPFKPKIEGDRLYGLGACDMKSGLVALLFGLKAFVDTFEDFAGEVIYSAVVDEEGFSKGAKALIREINADAAIIGEPYFAIERPAVIGATGKLLLEVKVVGKAAHAFRPWLGINAIEEASKIISKIADLEPIIDSRFGKIKPAVLKIEGGYERYNVTVPEECVFQVNRLTLPEETEEKVISWIKGIIESVDLKSKVEVKIRPPLYKGYVVKKDDPIVLAFRRAFIEEMNVAPKLSYYANITDANVITGEGGIPSIVFGPRGGNTHMANEYVELKTVEKAAKIYALTIKEFLALG